MKDYKRLTDDWANCRHCIDGMCQKPEIYCLDRYDCERTNRLKELEDKIEIGELCDREKVRKETAKDIFLWLAEHQEVFTGRITISCGDYMKKRKEYGVELFGNSDKGEYKE